LVQFWAVNDAKPAREVEVIEDLPRIDAWLGGHDVKTEPGCGELFKRFCNTGIQGVFEHPELFETSTVRSESKIDTFRVRRP
jgi:hypothetical protein